MKLSNHHDKLVTLISKKLGMKQEEYLTQLLLQQYRSTFRKEYVL